MRQQIVFDNWTLMNADYQDSKYTELTEKIIKIFYRVYNELDYGFLKKVYEKAINLLKSDAFKYSQKSR